MKHHAGDFTGLDALHARLRRRRQYLIINAISIAVALPVCALAAWLVWETLK